MLTKYPQAPRFPFQEIPPFIGTFVAPLAGEFKVTQEAV